MPSAGDRTIRFRPLAVEDLPLMHVWLNDPEVVRWWEGDDVSWGAVVRDYGPGSEFPAEHWIAWTGDGHALGWIQCYAVSDSPEEAAVWCPLGVDLDAAGIDYLIGSPSQRGRGLGSAMIRRFVREVVFPRHPGWTQVCASPFAENTASWRALASAGFTHVADYEADGGTCRLMALDRPPTGSGSVSST